MSTIFDTSLRSRPNTRWPETVLVPCKPRPTSPIVPALGVTLVSLPHGYEYLRARSKPHLYGDDLAEHIRDTFLEANGLIEWECFECEHVNLTPATLLYARRGDVACASCGS